MRPPLVLAVSVLVPVLCELAAHARSDAFRWFAPWIDIGADDVRSIERDRIVARILPASDSEIAVFFAGAINVAPSAFIDAVRRPDELWKSERVPRTVRFSSPPRPEDVATMQLHADDIEAVRRCRPGDCDVKLAAGEILRLQAAESIQDEFRRLVLDRVNRYLQSGLRTAGDFHDHRNPVDPQMVASGLLLRSPWLTERAPRLADYVESFPAIRSPGIESFVYWLETTHTPKPTIQVVHVMIARYDTALAAPDVLVVSRQVFASHYINGSLAVSALLKGPGDSGRYLAYVSRAHVDGLGGWLSGLRRLLVERAARSRGASAFAEQRRRIESCC